MNGLDIRFIGVIYGSLGTVPDLTQEACFQHVEKSTGTTYYGYGAHGLYAVEHSHIIEPFITTKRAISRETLNAALYRPSVSEFDGTAYIYFPMDCQSFCGHEYDLMWTRVEDKRILRKLKME